MLGGLSFGENFEVMNLMQESVAWDALSADLILATNTSFAVGLSKITENRDRLGRSRLKRKINLKCL
jgi:hypothetical protein